MIFVSFSTEKIIMLLLCPLSPTLNPYVGEIIGDHQCAFWHSKSTTDHIFCIQQLHEKKWEYNEAVHQLFKKAYDSVRREVW